MNVNKDENNPIDNEDGAVENPIEPSVDPIEPESEEMTAEKAMSILSDGEEPEDGEESNPEDPQDPTSESDNLPDPENLENPEEQEPDKETGQEDDPKDGKDPEQNDEDDDDEAFMDTIKNDRTRERFQTLSTKNKELSQLNEQQTQVIDTFQAQVARTGLSHEDFGQALAFAGDLNSDDWETASNAIEFFEQTVKLARERHGRVENAYERFDDLVKDLEDGEASEEYVNREAQRRIKENNDKDALEKADAQQREQQELLNKGVQEQGMAIENMVRQFQATDPDFALKEPMLEKMAQKIVADGVPMAQWSSEFVNRYHRIDVSQRKPDPDPMPAGRQAKNINNYADPNMSDEDANNSFAINEIVNR